MIFLLWTLCYWILMLMDFLGDGRIKIWTIWSETCVTFAWQGLHVGQSPDLPSPNSPLSPSLHRFTSLREGRESFARVWDVRVSSWAKANVGSCNNSFSTSEWGDYNGCSSHVCVVITSWNTTSTSSVSSQIKDLLRKYTIIPGTFPFFRYVCSSISFDAAMAPRLQTVVAYNHMFNQT